MSTKTVDEIIEDSVSNKFAVQVSLLASLTSFIVGTVLNISAQLSPYIRCEWGMTHFQVAMTSSIVYLGEGIGQWFWGKMSDIYGRRVVLLFTSASIIYFSLLAAASPTFEYFIAIRFFVGCGAGAAIVIASVYTSESVKTQHRGISFFPSLVLFNLGCIYTILVGYCVLNSYGWRLYLVCASVPTIAIMVPLVMKLPESIRFLEMTGNRRQLFEAVQKFCIVNRMSFPRCIAFSYKTAGAQASYSYLLRNCKLKTFSLCILWGVLILNYYGMVFFTMYQLKNENTCHRNILKQPSSFHHRNTTTTINHKGQCSSKLTQGDFIQALLITISEIPGALICTIFIEVWGRRPVIAIGLITNIAFYILQVICLPPLLSLVISFTNRGVSCGVATVLFVYTAELFPTCIRNTAAGLCGGVGKTFSALVPFIFQYLIYISVPVTITLMVGMSMVGLISLLFLRETRNERLPKY